MPFGTDQRPHRYDECTHYRYSEAASSFTPVEGLEPSYVNSVWNHADPISRSAQSHHSMLQCRRNRDQSVGPLQSPTDQRAYQSERRKNIDVGTSSRNDHGDSQNLSEEYRRESIRVNVVRVNQIESKLPM